MIVQWEWAPFCRCFVPISSAKQGEKEVRALNPYDPFLGHISTKTSFDKIEEPYYDIDTPLVLAIRNTALAMTPAKLGPTVGQVRVGSFRDSLLTEGGASILL